jgi:hypothetical protein
MLGEGQYTVMAVDRGGRTRIGEITGITSLRFDRIRDDTSSAGLMIDSPDPGCCELLASLRTVRHEIVIHRNGVRVWEGPITRLSYQADRVELDARDITWYLSRRVLEHPIDQVGDPVPATLLLYDLMLRHYPPGGDPFGVGPFLTCITGSDEARTAARYKPYTRTLFNLLEQYSHRGGIDYTVNGRRLVLWDTQTRVSVLPKLTDEVLSGSVNVTEYGQELKTRTFVTNSEDTYTLAEAPQEWLDYYGPIDFLDTNVDEGDGEPAAGDLVAMTEVAHRILLTGYPAPIRLWISENARLDPCYDAEFADLQAGAWVPIQSTRTCRAMSQWQKVQRVSVVWEPDGERVGVTLTKAPSYFVEPEQVITP